MENSEGDVIVDEDGNENARVLQENPTSHDAPFPLQRVCASGLSSDERRLSREANILEDDNEKGVDDNWCCEQQHKQMGDQDDDVHKLNHETSVGVENTSDKAKNNTDEIEIKHRMEETTCVLNQSSAFEDPICAESVDQVEESSHDYYFPSKFRNHANTDDSGIESNRSSEVDLFDEINNKLMNFNISSANKFKKVQKKRSLIIAMRRRFDGSLFEYCEKQLESYNKIW